MIPFLQQVARHYCRTTSEFTDLCFIFPNRRSGVFFQKYLSEEITGLSKPVLAPTLTTIDDFFHRLAGITKTDRIELLLHLYECYRKLNKKAESLDDFIFWGDVIMNDFSDVDRYLIDAGAIFTNVSDFKNLQDSLSYLTDTQREAIEKFINHFRTGGAMKESYLQIWDILGQLYTDFKADLKSSGLSYDGMVYRELAQRLDKEAITDILAESFPDCHKFIFVGLNALDECEKKVLRKMRNAHIAEFCWDFSSEMIKDPHNKSSKFLQGNVEEFTQAFTPDTDGLPTPEINVLSIPSNIGQAKQLPAILSTIPEQELETRTAIVLPDESLLLATLNSIPENIQKVNVTMGYPMKACALHSLMNEIASLQMHLRQKNGEWHFYHKQVWAIFSNSLIKTAASDDDRARFKQIKKDSKYYIPQSDLCGSELFDMIFKAVVKDSKAADSKQIRDIEDYCLSIISKTALTVKKEQDERALELDFAKRYYEAVTRLSSFELSVLPATWYKLLAQIVNGETVPLIMQTKDKKSAPFAAKSLQGLQIMGPLETRAIDFDNIIILSCNEGVFPKHPSSSSFIPAELRTGFRLPTYEYKDAMNAYYFYRLIQRAKKVWMLLDSRTEGIKSGEESRYIKQIELHFGLKVNRMVAKAPIVQPSMSTDIIKTAEDMQAIHSLTLSATAVQTYLACQAQFYYSKVKGLKAKDEVSEYLDSGTLGNVFHKTMQTLYEREDKTITKDYINALLKDKEKILNSLKEGIKEQLKTIDVSGRNLIFLDILYQYVQKTLERDSELMDSYGVNHFNILGLEKKTRATIEGFEFIGYIDRMDSFIPGEIRVVDYKTGKVDDSELDINESNAVQRVSELFGPDSQKRPKIALQLYLYDVFLKRDEEFKNKKIVNSIYPLTQLFVSPIQNMSPGKTFCDEMEQGLKSLLAELSDPGTPFHRTDNEKICEHCDFKMICGK